MNKKSTVKWFYGSQAAIGRRRFAKEKRLKYRDFSRFRYPFAAPINLAAREDQSIT